ncbi:MAG TPA: ABC transporter permease [Candidatus Kapabacteria bacterium]|nr:ABC transporter permease [Candidatus Kapabacteria bacterium]
MKITASLSVRQILEKIGRIGLFSGRFFIRLFRPPFELKEAIKQTYEEGVRSFALVAVVAIVIGAVLTLQSRPMMIKFGAEAFVPGMVAVSALRELCPVIVSVIVAGRVAAGIGAELGSMRVTEQIDAMEVAALDPFNYLVVTRVLACTIAMPLLTVYADVIAMLGSATVQYVDAGMSYRLYYSSIMNSLTFVDFLPGVIKTIIFGFIMGIVGCYEGFNSKGGTEGVGRSATDAVVISSLLILITDMLVVKLTVLLFDTTQ